MSGPLPLEPGDIEAFLRLHGVYLSPFEVELIEIIDDSYLASARTEASEEDKQQAIRDGLKGAAKGRSI